MSWQSFVAGISRNRLIRSLPVKVCEKDHIIREKKQQYVKREKSALHLLNNSPGIISLACTFQDPSKLYFVLTYAPQGEILRYINRLGSLNVECSRFYSGQLREIRSKVFFFTIFSSPTAELLLAIEEMHKKKIIHRWGMSRVFFSPPACFELFSLAGIWSRRICCWVATCI